MNSGSFILPEKSERLCRCYEPPAVVVATLLQGVTLLN